MNDREFFALHEGVHEHDSNPFRFLNISEMEFWSELHARSRHDLKCPYHPSGFRLDRVYNYVDIWWGGYEYNIKLDTLCNSGQVLHWLHHILTKKWEYATPRRIARLIEVLSDFAGLNVYEMRREGDTTLPDLSPEGRAAERAKLTPQLRYAVLVRDHATCVLCGATPESGAFLHIDHIEPIASGGKTEAWNLQVLCSTCNYGKGHK